MAARPPRDFGSGPMWKNILAQALPLTVAQAVLLLYNVVDRIYIGHMADGALALTGLGLTFPVVTIVMAFAALFGMGGVPLFSMARGAGDDEKAGRILGNSCFLLLCSAAAVTALCLIFCRPLLFAFGAGEASYAYAGPYLRIYLCGAVFAMLATGLGGYISAQGYPAIGMLAVVIGAVCNIALDPVCIFALRLGVRGAALATVVSQAVSAAWVLRFLCGRRPPVRLQGGNLKPDGRIVKDIAKLGTSNFIMQGTACLVQVACNTTLQRFGGDLYVGVMTVLSSVREVFTLAVTGMVSGALPVISYNYGAKRYDRVKQGIRFNTLAGAGYTLAAWLLVVLLPRVWVSVFTNDAAMIETGSAMLRIYFFGFVFMALQFAGQSTFQALGDAKHAIFFSLLRKAVIVVPLTLLLPLTALGVKGVFWAEPISNILGGTACFLTMYFTRYRKLEKESGFCQ